MSRIVTALLLSLALLFSGVGSSYALAPDTGTAEDMPTDWYGWWKMDRTSGDWSKMYGYFWDCCAVLSVEEGDRARLLLWDEDLSREILLADAVLSEKNGELKALSGSFLDRELSDSDWSVAKTEDDCGTLLTIEGQYKAVGKGGFHYIVYLRPWGSLWPGDEDEKPWYYEQWYLPLIEAGKPMPDEIGKQEKQA